jgi:hypothetical protein
MRKEGEIRGIPVAWSDLRYHSRVDGKVQYRTIYHPSSSNKSSEERNMVENNKVTANPNVESKEAVHFSSPEFGVALTQLPIIGIHDKRCPICNREPDGMSRIEYMVYDNEENAIKRFGHARHCSNCDVVFLDASYAKAITNQDSNYRVFTLDASRYKTAEALLSAATEKPSLHKIAPSIVKLPFAFSEKEIPNLSSESKVVSVYARKCHCKRCRDKYGVETIRNRTAVISTVAGDVVEVNVMFCAGCGRYFMNYTSFQMYRRTHGGLLLEYRFTGELAENNSAEYNFAPDSILSRCGYTVQHGVSEAYRRAVLRYILDSGKATKREIIELITGFIDLREYNPMYDGACARWRSDIFYVNQYRIQEQKKVYGLSFKQGR